jgi:hypothetical protein
MGVEYANDRNVTFLTGPDGPGSQDVWMTGYKDGECDILLLKDEETCTNGKVSYLGGHSYSTDVPLSRNADAQGTRLFLNALFEADCVTTDGQPRLALTLAGPDTLPTSAPQGSYVVGYSNAGIGTALDAVLVLELPAGVTVDDDGGGTVAGSTVTFTVGSIGASGTLLPPPAAGSRTVVLSFAGEGVYTLTARLDYRVGATELGAGPSLLDVGVGITPPPRDGGTGDGNGDTSGGDGGGSGDGGSGCGCRLAPAGGIPSAFLLGGALALLLRRRRG